ncbi:MAG: hypothetical protein ACE5E6_01780 [Phycisphaerae bacterium]
MSEGGPAFCLQCGYNLHGLPTPRCPECGHVHSRREWNRRLADIRQLKTQVEWASEWAGLAMGFAAGGAALWLLGLLLGLGGGMAGALGCLAAIVCGFCATFLGLGVFRAKRLPPWAYERLRAKPRYEMAAGAIAIGTLLVVLGFVTL